MSESIIYNHKKIPEVLEAYKLLLNDTMALDYCGISGKDRIMILNDPDFSREARKIKAEKYVEEITDINDLVDSLKRTSSTNENARFGEGDDDPTKVINLKMKVSLMRRDMLSLSSNEKENEETESLNIFFIDVTRDEFERLLNVEIHEGEQNSRLIGESDKDAPVETADKRKKTDKPRSSVPIERSRNSIEYTDENGDKVIEEVGV